MRKFEKLGWTGVLSKLQAGWDIAPKKTGCQFMKKMRKNLNNAGPKRVSEIFKRSRYYKKNAAQNFSP